jgi:type II secretory pathway component PulF
MYPSFVLLVVLAVVYIMMTQIVPSLLEIFESEETLPASTQLLIAISDFLVGNWLIMALGTSVLLICFFIWK